MSDEQAMPAPRRKRNIVSRIFRSHDFLRDLTVTTLGVLIALGIGQIVDEIRWKFRIQATDRVMREELSLVHGTYVEKLILQPCIARRLSEIGEILSEARQSSRLPDIRNVAYPPNHGGFGDSWNLMIGSDIPLHVDPKRLMNTATAWANEEAYAQIVDRERDAFDRLMLMEGRPGPVSDGMLDELEKQWTEARIASDSALFIARQDADVMAENGIRPMITTDLEVDRKQLVEQSRQRNLCRPLIVDGQPYRLKGPVRQSRTPFAPQQG